MPRLVSHLDRSSESFAANERHMRRLTDDLNSALDRVRAGGGEAAVERHRGRGKLLARERIERLVDPGAAFLEKPFSGPELLRAVRQQLDSGVRQ